MTEPRHGCGLRPGKHQLGHSRVLPFRTGVDTVHDHDAVGLGMVASSLLDLSASAVSVGAPIRFAHISDAFGMSFECFICAFNAHGIRNGWRRVRFLIDMET